MVKNLKWLINEGFVSELKKLDELLEYITTFIYYFSGVSTCDNIIMRFAFVAIEILN